MPLVEHSDTSTLSTSGLGTSVGDTHSARSSTLSSKKSSVRIIKPRSDSARNSLERAKSQLTINQLRFSDSALYGREAQVKLLKDSFLNKKKHNSCSLLSGKAGVGKSALAYQIKPLVVRKAGFFFTGKYQQQQDEPYAAFTMICQELCDALTSHKADPYSSHNKWRFTFEEIQTKLRDELGGGDHDELQVLTTVFPDLFRIVGGDYLDADDNSEIGYNEAQQRFQHAFRRLIRVLSTFGRVVLFLDDLQWADEASLVLFKSLMTDCQTTTNDASSSSSPSASTAAGSAQGNGNTGIRNAGGDEDGGLLVLGSYRSEQVDDSHALTTIIQELEDVIRDDPNLPLEVNKLEIRNLDVDQVNEMLVDLLAPDNPQDTLSLAECVFSKTKGNVFYVIQFLKALASQSNRTADEEDEDNSAQLLSFNIGTFKWVWNVEEIKLRESATKNVVEMIQEKMRMLPIGVYKVIPIVACLGASFQYSIFERVLEHFNGMLLVAGKDAMPPAEFMEICEREGLLVYNKDRGTVKWDHDQIQEAALNFADKEEISGLRCQLGELLMEEMSHDERVSNIFVLVGNLDQNTENIPEDNSRRIMLADLYCTAGEKAMQGAAFTSASNYLTRGVSLLPDNHWKSHDKLSLDLFSSAAEALLCVGRIEDAERYCDAICSQDEIPIMDKQRAYIVLLDAMNARGDTRLAQEKCVEVLALLDCNFPKYGWTFHTIACALKTEMTAKKLETDIPKLPIMTDESKKWVMRLLDRLTTSAYHNKSDIFALVVFKSLKYTLKYGISDYSPPVLCTVGLLLAAAMGDLKAGRKFGEMALSMFGQSWGSGKVNRISRRTKARTQFIGAGFSLHWQIPLSMLRKNLLDGYRCGISGGDTESALWSIFCYIEFGFHTGLPLATLEKDCIGYTQQMKDLKNKKIALPTRCLWQVIANLRGRSDDPSELNGDAFCLGETLAESDAGHMNRMQLTTAFWSGDFTKTVKLIEETDAHKGEFDKVFAGSYALAPLHFQCSMACFSVFRKTKTGRYKSMALFHAKHIQKWSRKGNPNAMHYASLVQAEISSLNKRKFRETIQMFKEAITLTGRQGILHDQALANERLAEFYLRHDLTSDAAYHFNEAFNLYNEWGSNARADLVFLTHKGKIVAPSNPSTLSLQAECNDPSLLLMEEPTAP